MSELIANPVAPLSLNGPQLLFQSYLHQITEGTNISGRGSSKSSEIALLMDYINRHMPRSAWAIQSATYVQALTKTLPSTIRALERLGWRRDIDFFINRFPPKDYALPYECPLTPDNCIFFVNHKYKYSVVYTIFSQDRSTSRGTNRDGILCDESLLLDHEKFAEETLATNRGNEEYFGRQSHRPRSIHHGVFHWTSMPTGESWLLDHGDYYLGKLDVRGIRNQIIELQMAFIRAKDKEERMEYWSQVIELRKELQYYPSKKGMLYREYDTFDNLQNLGLRFILDLYNNMPEHLFMVEIMNQYRTKIEDTFYPGLNRDMHCYKGNFNNAALEGQIFEENQGLDCSYDLDCNPNQPLHLGLDFGVQINWIVVGQEDAPARQFNFLKNLYVKTPATIDDVTAAFIQYYAPHKRKMIYLWPDGEGNVRRQNVRGQATYVQQIEAMLRKAGWSVIIRKQIKYNTPHREAYITWARCLGEKMKEIFPVIRFNLINCKELVYSMEQTPAIDFGKGDMRKNKASEKLLVANREQATDAGDAADQIIRGLYGPLNKGVASAVNRIQD